jgi:hypothetical protein
MCQSVDHNNNIHAKRFILVFFIDEQIESNLLLLSFTCGIKSELWLECCFLTTVLLCYGVVIVVVMINTYVLNPKVVFRDSDIRNIHTGCLSRWEEVKVRAKISLPSTFKDRIDTKIWFKIYHTPPVHCSHQRVQYLKICNQVLFTKSASYVGKTIRQAKRRPKVYGAWQASLLTYKPDDIRVRWSARNVSKIIDYSNEKNNIQMKINKVYNTTYVLDNMNLRPTIKLTWSMWANTHRFTRTIIK